MSAIFGILDLKNRPIDPNWIKSMQEDLAHRGPDGQRLYQEDSLVLGNMLLQVAPESIYDKSPYEEGGMVITANARLDEREALMDRLNIDTEEREKATDPVLLLRSYLKYGKDFVKDIYGDFSFVIWDKEKKELFCARDQMGVKPFLYYFEENRFVFSTELKAIVKLPFVNTAIDQYILRNRAIAIWNEPQKTTWKNIQRLKPANSLSLIGNNLSLNHYWIPKYKRNNHFKKEEDSATALRKLLEKVISDHTRTIGDVGATLSGGLDSSTVVCLAARKLLLEGKKITTVSSIYKPGFEDPDNPDEMDFINVMAQQEKNIDPTFVNHTELKFLNDLHKIFNRQYAPANGFHYVDEAINKQFQLKSIRRVLSGYLGDFTVSNSSIKPFSILLFSGKFASFYSLTLKVRKNTFQTWSHYIKSIMVEFSPVFIRKTWNKYKGKNTNPWNIEDLPLLLKPNEKLALQKKVLNTFRQPNIRASDVIQHLWPNNNDLFEEDWDCGNSWHQIETTYPLSDRRVVELLLQIPVEHFYADGLRRGLIRKAMRGILPDRIRERKTKGEYSPGYPMLIQKDMIEIVSFLDKYDPTSGTDKLINYKKLKSELENLVDLYNNNNFTYSRWALVEFVLWIYFDHWFYLKTKMKSITIKKN